MRLDPLPHRLVLPLLASAALAAVALALQVGALTDADWSLIVALRLPRVVGAFACGGLLAVAGALLQVLSRNPLAEPYLLGVSGGASVGALLAMLAVPLLPGLALLGGAAWVTGGALLGALASLLLLAMLLLRQPLFGPDRSARLILSGVMLATGYGALVSLLLAVAPQGQLPGMLFWLMGDLNGVVHYVPVLVVWMLVLAVTVIIAPQVNLLLLGDARAQTLGVAVTRLRRWLLGIAALATAAAVATAGAIGFVGLLVPHLLRLLIGDDQRRLLPAAALAGGILLLGADTLARTIVAPGELPVGVVTALLGVPTFLWLLTRAGALARQ